MKRKKSQPNRRLISLGLAFVGVVALVAVVVISNQPNSSPAPASSVIATIDPAIIANLTALPEATLIAPPITGEIQALEEQIAACDEYSDERRAQVQQHIRWLFHPDEIPMQVGLALGVNPAGRLIYGMAIYTSTEWRLNERPRPSCLLDIGQKLNELLLATGEEALTIYEETDTPQ
ncbi:MAG: hypothetical protein K8L99_21345 [Anaerolineae bacterium]|nr:hypothetical protein [Anaerolineae bacterium]